MLKTETITSLNSPDTENTAPAALVTGACSGIGFYYSSELAVRGYNVIMVSDREKDIKKAAEQIASLRGCTDLSGIIETAKEKETIKFIKKPCTGTGQWIAGIYKDLSLKDSAEKLFDFYPDITVLVNNAGIFIFRDVTGCSTEKIEKMLNLHILTVTKLCRLYGEKMKERKQGYILNMSSISAMTPFPGISLYAATKSYIRTFTKALGYELREYGIKVITITPGAVATDLYNLPADLQRLGMKLGIIYRPEKLAKKALDKLFRGKKVFVPGFVNRFLVPLYALLPCSFIMWGRRKTESFIK